MRHLYLGSCFTSKTQMAYLKKDHSALTLFRSRFLLVDTYQDGQLTIWTTLPWSGRHKECRIDAIHLGLK
jgi:hypothetical protein